MKILLTIPHDTLLKPQGFMVRVEAILRYCDGHEVFILMPDSVPMKYLSALSSYKIYFFKEPNISRIKIPYLLDFSLSYLMTARLICKERKIDCILSNFPWGITSLRKIVQLPILYISHGVEVEFVDITIRKLGIKNRVIKAIIKNLVRFIEGCAIRSAEATVAMSDRDAELLKILYSPKVILPLPHTIDEVKYLREKSLLRRRLRLPENKIILIFHGSTNHLPNEEAIDFIFKDLVSSFSDLADLIHIVIIGEKRVRSRSNFYTCFDFVELLEDYLSASDIGIMPIFSGSGVRMKFFDFLQVGLKMVSTMKGVEGIDVSGLSLVFVSSDDKKDFLKLLRSVILSQEPVSNAETMGIPLRFFDSESRGKLNKLLKELI